MPNPKSPNLNQGAPRPFAILPSALAGLLADVADKQERLLAMRHAQPKLEMPAAADPMPSASGVLVIPVRGGIFPRETMLTRVFGLFTLDRFRAQLKAAMADDNVSAVVLDVNSPGGIAEGLGETAELMRSLRGSKPIVAVSDTLMASAAYYIGSQADLVVAAPDSFTGSVGTVVVHWEESRWLDAEGISVNIFRNPERKYEGNTLEPLSETAAARFQQIVDTYSNAFQSDVAKGRGVAVAKVRSDFGQGDVLMEREALRAGMVDRIATLEQTVARLAGRRGRGGAARAELREQWPAEQQAAGMMLPDDSEAERARAQDTNLRA